MVREPTLLHKVSTLTEGERSPFSIRMYQTGQIRFIAKHFGRAVAWAQAPLLYGKAVARRLAGKDDNAGLRQRFAAITTALTRSA